MHSEKTPDSEELGVLLDELRTIFCGLRPETTPYRKDFMFSGQKNLLSYPSLPLGNEQSVRASGSGYASSGL